MSFESVFGEPVRPGGRRVKGYDFRVLVSRQKSRPGILVYQVSIAPYVVKELKWKLGEHVDLLVDQDTFLGRVVRTGDAETGWALMGAKAKGNPKIMRERRLYFAFARHGLVVPYLDKPGDYRWDNCKGGLGITLTADNAIEFELPRPEEQGGFRRILGRKS